MRWFSRPASCQPLEVQQGLVFASALVLVVVLKEDDTHISTLAATCYAIVDNIVSFSFDIIRTFILNNATLVERNINSAGTIIADESLRKLHR